MNDVGTLVLIYWVVGCLFIGGMLPVQIRRFPSLAPRGAWDWFVLTFILVPLFALVWPLLVVEFVTHGGD